MDKVLVDTAFAQGALPVAVRVKVTVPVSPAPGVYVAVVSEEGLAIVPVPSDDQMIPALLVADAPAVIFTTEFEHVVTAVPATAVGALEIFKVLVDTAFAQGALPVAVRVKVTVPVSPAPGVYVAVVSEEGLAIVPVPSDDQMIPALLVADAPAVIFTTEFEHVVTPVPATAVGALEIFKVLVDTAFAQGALPVAVRVKVTVPVSPAPGVYVAVVSDEGLAIVPVPSDDQMIPALLVADAPAVIFTTEFEHVVTAVPATAVGALEIFKVLVDTAFAQGALPVAVRVKVTVPVSPAPGVYVAVVSEEGLAIVPVPSDDQMIPALLVADAPAVIFTTEFEHVVTAVPATAVGALEIFKVLVDTAFAQGALPVAVRVKVTVPVSPAPGVYVAVVSEEGLAIVPVPSDDQMIPALLVADAPAVIFTTEFEHVVTAVPATAVGAVEIFKVLVDTAFAQGELPVAVRVKVTVPVSPAPGV